MSTSQNPVLNVSKGEMVDFDGQEYVVLKLIDLTKALARNVSTKETQVLEIRHLRPWRAAPADDIRKSQQSVDLLDVLEDDWDEARNRLSAISPLLKERKRGDGLVERISNEFGVSPPTIYRWRDMYVSSGCLLTSLLPTKRSGGRGKGRLSAEVDAIIEDTLKNFYLTDQKRSIEDTVGEVRRLCCNANLPIPHWTTVKNRINWQSERERYSRRHGERAAQQIFDPINGTVPNAGFPLALSQIDHTPIPLMIVDEVIRRSIGRPYGRIPSRRTAIVVWS